MEDASEPARHEYVEVEVVDSTGNPLGRTLAFEIVTPPTVTRDGRFLLSLRSDNPDSQGGMMLCTIQVDDAVLVTFTGELQSLADHRGWQVAITAEGMPTFAQQDVEIPWRQVRLSLQEIEPHAP